MPGGAGGCNLFLNAATAASVWRIDTFERFLLASH